MNTNKDWVLYLFINVLNGRIQSKISYGPAATGPIFSCLWEKGVLAEKKVY